jgi:hypothetical protein
MRTFVSAETFRDILDYDPETGLFVWKARDERHVNKKSMKQWNSRWARKPAFIHSDYGAYLRASIFGVFYSAHRVAWAIVHGDPVPEYLDHIDGDRQNNRISNLRPTDKVENSKNRGIRSDNTTGRTGIHKTKCGTYKVRIFVFGRDTYLGTFKKFEDAVAARKEAERAYGFSEGHGERQGIAWAPKERAA